MTRKWKLQAPVKQKGRNHFPTSLDTGGEQPSAPVKRKKLRKAAKKAVAEESKDTKDTGFRWIFGQGWIRFTDLNCKV